MVVDDEEVLVLIPHEFIQLYAVFETNIQIKAKQNYTC